MSVLSEAKISAARIAAFEILERVATTSDHSDDLLHGRRLIGLSQADRNLATALVLGVLRWQIALDARIKPLLSRPDVVLGQPILTALRLGAFQLLHMDRIPAHAALSESVELIRAAGHGHAAGMVNAILRKITRQVAVRKPLVETTPVFAERLGHPGWLVERWVKNYGRAAAIAICEYDQREPVSGGMFGVAEEGLPRLDDGSRLVAEIAARVKPSAKRIWDCCAAPGGKTLLLAKRHPEADLLASDVNGKRTKAMELRLQKEGVSGVRTMEADATSLPESERDFDLILCDVPCSGTGTLARNPEIRHHLRVSDLRRQVERQKAILGAALGRLAVGGRLVYSTCSLEPEENEGVVQAVQVEAVERIPVPNVVLGVDVGGFVRDGYLRTLPGVGFEGDGFFAAVFQRV